MGFSQLDDRRWLEGGWNQEQGALPPSRGRSAPLSCSDVGRRSVIAYRFGCLHISHQGDERTKGQTRPGRALPRGVTVTHFPLLPYPMDTRADTTCAPSTSGEPALPETAPYGMRAAAVTTFWPLLAIDNGRPGEISKRPVFCCSDRSLTARAWKNVERLNVQC